MTNKFIISLFFILSLTPTYSQDLKPFEESATTCIEGKLAKAGIDREYIYNSFEEYNQLRTQMDIDALDKKQAEIDSIFTICGFYKDNHLQVSDLIECFEKEYDLKENLNDTTNSYYNLLTFLHEWNDNQELMQQLSPQLLMGALHSTISESDRHKAIYRLSSFIIFQGIMREFKNYAESRKESDNEDNSNNYETKDKEFTLVDTKKSNPNSDDEIFFVVDKMPEFPGGNDALIKYLETEPKHPIDVNKSTGVVFVQFIIDETGKVKDPKILRGLTPSYDVEAIRVIKSMPIWTPGEKNGVKVKVLFTKPVKFN